MLEIGSVSDTTTFFTPNNTLPFVCLTLAVLLSLQHLITFRIEKRVMELIKCIQHKYSPKNVLELAADMDANSASKSPLSFFHIIFGARTPLECFDRKSQFATV